MKNFHNSKSAFDRAEYPQALADIEVHLAEYPQHPEALYLRGMIYFKSGKLPEAIVSLTKAIEVEANNPEYISDRAVAYFNLSLYAEALKDFDLAVTLEPENPYRYASRGFLKDKMGDHRGAIEDYEKALLIDSDNDVTRNNLAFAEENLKYKTQNPRRIKSKDSFTSEEVEAYEKQYDKTLSDRNSSVWHEMASVFRSKENFKDFQAQASLPG